MKSIAMFLRINKPNVVHEAFDDELVVVNLDRGYYYSLGQSGADVWRLVEEGVSVDEVVQWMIARYDAPGEEIEQAVHKLIGELQQEELIVQESQREPVAGDPQPREVASSGTKLAFQAPVLQRYSDMQELLLLDPIHEVDETGWPNARAMPDATANPQ